MTLQMPAGVNAVVDVTAPGVKRAVALGSGAVKSIALPIDTAKPWRLQLKARRPILLPDNRVVSTRSTPPRFVEGKASASTCR